MLSLIVLESTTVGLQPFNLNLNTKWVLETFLPTSIAVIIAVFGWILVYWLNRKNMLKEKEVLIRVQAYDFIKNSLKNLMESYSKLGTYTWLLYQVLERFEIESALYEIDKKNLLQAYKSDTFTQLYYNSENCFKKFIISCNQYEYILNYLTPDIDSLEKKNSEVYKRLGSIISNYNLFILTLEENIYFEGISRQDLKEEMKEAKTIIEEFSVCIRDISFRIQTFVFSRVTKRKKVRK